MHSGEPTSQLAQVVSWPRSQGEDFLLLADRHAHHADEPGGYYGDNQANGCECDRDGHGGTSFAWVAAGRRDVLREGSTAGRCALGKGSCHSRAGWLPI